MEKMEKKEWKNCNRFREKLGQKALQLGLNGQKLAKKSDVSDSEISRIMNGKSLPGLENAIALAKAHDISLDFLADDALDVDPRLPKASANDMEALILKLAHDVGYMEAYHILQNTRLIGYDLAATRMLDSKPTIAAGEGTRPQVSAPTTSSRANTG